MSDDSLSPEVAATSGPNGGTLNGGADIISLSTPVTAAAT